MTTPEALKPKKMKSAWCKWSAHDTNHEHRIFLDGGKWRTKKQVPEDQKSVYSKDAWQHRCPNSPTLTHEPLPEQVRFPRRCSPEVGYHANPHRGCILR